MKAPEPFFSSGVYFKNVDMGDIAAKVKERISTNKDLLNNMDNDDDSIAKAHK